VTEELKNTVRILRRNSSATDEKGRPVEVNLVETTRLELVSTQMLEAMILEGDNAKREELKAAASGGAGVLAHDPEKDAFEIVSDDDLMAALAASTDESAPLPTADVVYEIEEPADDVEELSLVSTQMLRAMLDPNAEALIDQETGELKDEPGGGFDPYNSS